MNTGVHMGACRNCGQGAGLGRDQCSACRIQEQQESQKRAAELEAERLRAEQEAAQKAADELNQRTLDHVNQTIEQMRVRLAQGMTPSLISVEMLSTTYALNGEIGGAPPDPSRLAVYLANGWRITGTIPQTEGSGLSNRHGNGGSSWGGGVGGLVTGIYVLLTLPITLTYLEAHEKYVRDCIQAQYLDGVSDSVLSAGFSPTNGASSAPNSSTLMNVGLGVAGGLLIADSVSGAMDMGDIDDGGGGDFGGFDF